MAQPERAAPRQRSAQTILDALASQCTSRGSSGFTGRAQEASVGGVPRHRVRFAFTIPDGAHAGLTNGGWRLWVRGEDTYLTNRAFGDVWKLSLHLGAGPIEDLLVADPAHWDQPMADRCRTSEGWRAALACVLVMEQRDLKQLAVYV
ncbi:MAG: UDP-N-acetylmuramoyl-tripeptide--D-alanyl-D-alanine ligase [Frankiales bacterium]|nr:UDP-N-acetylmuramoyl-tripeptide--D-alanyl-D-alanine ligase [Frankiales bacterium]